MFEKILIANRGEIALRIIRACKELSIKTVIIHSTEDSNSLPVKLADESVCIGPAHPKDSYLNAAGIISAAEITGADAIHPGYGFLSEDYNFAESVEKSGFVFIGPKSKTIREMGNKISAIQIMKKNKINCIPGYNGNPSSDQEYKMEAKKIGYPILIKAAAGGGGRGMRLVKNEDELISQINLSKQEARIAFASDEIYLEKYLKNPRHIEVQVLADNYGNVVHLYDRDCSIQRRNQKIIEEAPAFKLKNEQREILGNICVNACKKLDYEGLGTFEFLYENGKFYFIEMNTRIQVEHAVTEMITGIDLVKEQIKLSSGEKLSFKQSDLNFSGHAIECRINAEDPENFNPSPGTIDWYHPPAGIGIRMDTHIYSGYKIPTYYDSLLGKLIAYGKDREEAIEKLKAAFDEMIIKGVKTNIPLFIDILIENNFTSGNVDIRYLDTKLEININKK